MRHTDGMAFSLHFSASKVDPTAIQINHEVLDFGW
jgi:hypothetical protein